MTVKPFDKAERDATLRGIAAAKQSYDAAKKQRDSAACTAHFAEIEKLRREYFDRLPCVCMAACPICSKPLYRLFDPFGFDGLWWSESPSWTEPPACPHFVLLRGAVNLNGRPTRAGTTRVFPGPEVPYVIPRLLDWYGMVMVIGALDMQPGHTAYPLAYFAPKRPSANELTSVWARPTFEYRNAAGDAGWDFAVDPWDFDLLLWLQKGKVRWCDSGSANERLSSEAPAQCPYLNLPGEQQAAELVEVGFRLIGVPDGQPSFPID